MRSQEAINRTREVIRRQHKALATVRPDGIACRVQAWKPGFGLGQKADYELTLTEFPDPDCKATYFRLRDYGVAANDELFSGR